MPEGGIHTLMSPWPLGLARYLRYPALTVSLVVAALTLGIYTAVGAWFPEQYSHRWNSPEQVTGFALTYVAMLSYLAGFFIFGARKTLQAANELQPILLGAQAEGLVARLNRMPRSRFGAATGVGVLLGLANIDLRILDASERVLPTWPMDVSLMAGSMLIWVFAVQVVCLRIESGILLSRLGRRLVAVDLFQTHSLKPFARVGILDTLMMMGVLAMTPLQSLDAEFRAVNYTFAFSAGLPSALLLLMLPMLGIHRRLREEKSRHLEEVYESITLAERSHDPDSLTYFNALLDRRAYIHSANTWPMDVRTLGRVLFYLTIPPLAWIGAALVEMLVQGFVDAA